MKKSDTTNQQTGANQRTVTNQDLSAALFEFRDALVTLSLSLKDLLFEQDQQGRQATEQATQALFEKIRQR
jgi:hypothetical protein